MRLIFTKNLTFVILGLLFTIQSFALSNQDLLNNLVARLHPLPGRGALIKSFDNHSQSYIYDQALSIITFTKEGKKEEARKLLMSLESLQDKEGSLYFSYYLDGKSPYPVEGDKRIAGSIAWVALAAAHYQHRFQSKEFYSFNKKILEYLITQLASITINREDYRAIRFAPSDIKSTHFNEKDVIALEHNLDAYAAFSHFKIINKSKKWDKEVRGIKSFIMAMWDSPNEYFWSGATISSGRINKSELYLDNQSWSLLALDDQTLSEITPKKALQFNCEVFYVKDKNVKGFMDSKPVRRDPMAKFVWSEGTLGQILAMKRVKLEKSSCNNLSPDDFLVSIKKMKKKDNGIAYATSDKNPDFTTASSVAGTTWYYFALNGINPFQLN